MCPCAHTDGHDAPWLVGEAVPSEAAMVEDVVVGFEDAVRQPVVAHGLPDVLLRPFDFAQESVELGAFRRRRQQRDVGVDDQPCRDMPLDAGQHARRQPKRVITYMVTLSRS